MCNGLVSKGATLTSQCRVSTPNSKQQFGNDVSKFSRLMLTPDIAPLRWAIIYLALIYIILSAVWIVWRNFAGVESGTSLPDNAIVSGLYGPGFWRVFVLSTWFAVWKTISQDVSPGFDPDLMVSTIIIIASSADLIRLCIRIEKLETFPPHLWHWFIAAALSTHYGFGAAFIASITGIYFLAEHNPGEDAIDTLKASRRALGLWIINLISAFSAMTWYEGMIHRIPVHSLPPYVDDSHPAVSMERLQTWLSMIVAVVTMALCRVYFYVIIDWDEFRRRNWVKNISNITLLCFSAVLGVIFLPLFPTALCLPLALVSGTGWFPESGISWWELDQLAAMIGFILPKLFELLPPVLERFGINWEVCLFKWLRPCAPSWLRQRMPQEFDSNVSDSGPVTDGGELNEMNRSQQLVSNVSQHMEGTSIGVSRQRNAPEVTQNVEAHDPTSNTSIPENVSPVQPDGPTTSDDHGPSTVRKRSIPNAVQVRHSSTLLRIIAHPITSPVFWFSTQAQPIGILIFVAELDVFYSRLYGSGSWRLQVLSARCATWETSAVEVAAESRNLERFPNIFVAAAILASDDYDPIRGTQSLIHAIFPM
ncbi:uncharacterized protein EI90DRAFT_3018469 [Cantharellus anzutake]|uniref:uncharacterized protein n=1 Tax=Cantharellus anzutake TaxID=1750568 RepID=UPI0019049BD9|nr:uncharacterized protein EI90DRAFT_3018469 [Cantharellus anzutake]KAF8326869.1 hypothetical protein EI90DRAFT_3018469 [Cantharellus anzutake]